MYQSILRIITIIALAISTVVSTTALASDTLKPQIPPTPTSNLHKPASPNQLIPTPPTVNATAYVLMDANSGQIIAEKNGAQHIPPASLTKMMTLYVTSEAIKNGQLSLDTPVHISKKAWRTGGSRMFVKVNSQVPVSELLQGIIVASGNDACVALAEHIAGSEDAFAQLMNQTATKLGMNNSHFMDSTGLPNENHYSTPHDLATLARHLVLDFPENYHWYKQKWYTYNNIKQPNRNRLLWRDNTVDGIKTGHTEAAGYCLVSSAERNGMRLIAVVLGTPSDNDRTDASQALLNFGFRFYETHKLFSANEPLDEPRVYQAIMKKVPMGLQENLYVTIPSGQFDQVKANLTIAQDLKAPINKDEPYGSVKVNLHNKEITEKPLVALVNAPKGNFWARFRDRIILTFHNWF